MNLLNNVTDLSNIVHELPESPIKERLFNELKHLSEDIKSKDLQTLNSLKEIIQQIEN